MNRQRLLFTTGLLILLLGLWLAMEGTTPSNTPKTTTEAKSEPSEPLRREFPEPTSPPNEAQAEARTPNSEPPEENRLDVPPGSAHCNVLPLIPSASGHLVVGDAGRIPYDGRRVTVNEGVATLPYVDGAGAGVLSIDGFAPVKIQWTQSGCSPDPIQLSAGETWLGGHVRNAEGEPEGRVFVEGCGNQALTDADGTYAMTVSPGPCTVNAFRRDGLLVGKADAADLIVVEGKEHVMDFVLPELPTAGLGIQIAAQADGFAIQGVVPGTAADDLGLESGDVVIEVDGTPTPGLSIEEFVDLAVGPVGTEVDIVVMRGGQPQRLTLDRREITRGPG